MFTPGSTLFLMPSGKEPPFISQENVRAALEGLLYASVEKPPNPMLHLLLVTQLAAHPAAPPGPHVLEFSLNSLLTTIITDELRSLRHTLGLSPLAFDVTFESVLIILQTDGEIDSPELTGWDWLYYHYVRIDLNIGHEIFCQATHIEDRTLRRYQQHAIKRLTQRLIHDEWQMRAEQRNRRLYSELPGEGRQLLIGRTEILSQIEGALQTAYPQHVCITGAAGVGKSALAEAILRRQIQQERLEDLIWLYKPVSAAFIREYLTERLLPETGQMSLHEYLQLYPTAIVMDNVEEVLLSDLSALQSLLTELNPALVILTSRVYTKLPEAIHISLNDLKELEAEEFITHSLQQSGNFEASEIDWYQIYGQVGGNPLAIKLFVHNLHFFEKRFTTLRSAEELFKTIYGQLNPLQQQHWFMFALLPPGMATTKQLTDVWPILLSNDSLTALLQNHLIEGVRPFQMGFMLSTTARRFIEAQYHTNDQAHLVIQALIDSLNLDSPHVSMHLADTLEYLLGCDWLEIDLERRRRWLLLLWQHGLTGEHWLIWRSLFESQLQALTSDQELLLAYGVCLRRLGHWSSARQIFEMLIFQTGRQGAFLRQAQTLLELAILSRYEGEYEKAQVFAMRAENIAARSKETYLLDNLKLERAQIAIDSGDLRGAIGLASTLPNSKRSWYLQSEILLLHGHFERSRALAQQILTETNCKNGEQARLQTLIGRTYEKQDNRENAQFHFGTALTLLENEHDPFALSRAQTNLAAVLIQLSAWDEARQLLTQAEATQSQLNDRLALEITRHNQRLLDAHIAG